jgi:hypothetical protein
MKKWIVILFVLSGFVTKAFSQIDLSGEWRFQADPADKGVSDRWYARQLPGTVKLPGSMTTNGKGDDITINTPWTGEIVDSSYFFLPQYARYREAGHIKVPFWLQPEKYYKGAAWYQKTVTIPASWKEQHVELFIERSHWETTVWIDDQPAGMQNSLGTPHTFDMTGLLTPGEHQVTVRVDNRVKDINVGMNSHSITDHTQTNWNGMTGRLLLAAKPLVYVQDVQVFPDIAHQKVDVKVYIRNATGKQVSTGIQLQTLLKGKAIAGTAVKPLMVAGDSLVYEQSYSMGAHPLLWDEFHSDVYTMRVQLSNGDRATVDFGMREFKAAGRQLTINGRKVFLRGTLECAVFPETGYPPTEIAPWLRIFEKAKSYGLNHLRFHSWCPPAAAFEAADKMGFYLQIECSSWANTDTRLSEGKPIDKYIYAESEAIVKAYGNHPSFCMLTYGNEPSGAHYKEYLADFTTYWKQKDTRRLYTAGSGWPAVDENDYHVTPDPRIQSWGGGLKSIINGQHPRSDYDWSAIISAYKVPVVSHEIGQWCVYPDLKEIKRYTGVLKAKNFEIFRQTLTDNGLARLADSFLLASGKLQALCYKADIEAALRTPDFGGFQLLGLYDFPGQGTALVGVLNAFWEDKGYITGKEFSRFCNTTVPLVRLPKMVYQQNETLLVPVEVAHFGERPILHAKPEWKVTDARGKVLFKGVLPQQDIPVGNGIQLGGIRQELGTVQQPSALTLTVKINGFENSWDIFVYPATLPVLNDDVLVTQELDEQAVDLLNKGGRVLLSLKKGALKSEYGGKVEIGFSSIFWNTAWTHGQAPHTLGLLCDPGHPVFRDFPTQYHSNWQWWDAVSHANAIMGDAIAPGLSPLVRVIDDWVTARSLGLLYECKVGKGRLMLCGIDLLADAGERVEARQLRYSIVRYMGSDQFKPAVEVQVDRIRALTGYR